MKAATYLRSVKKLYAPDLDHVEIGSEPDHWIYRVETDGSLGPAVAIRKAISIVMEKLKEVESESTMLKPYEAPPA